MQRSQMGLIQPGPASSSGSLVPALKQQQTQTTSAVASSVTPPDSLYTSLQQAGKVLDDRLNRDYKSAELNLDSLLVSGPSPLLFALLAYLRLFALSSFNFSGIFSRAEQPLAPVLAKAVHLLA